MDKRIKYLGRIVIEKQTTPRAWFKIFYIQWDFPWKEKEVKFPRSYTIGKYEDGKETITHRVWWWRNKQIIIECVE